MGRIELGDPCRSVRQASFTRRLLGAVVDHRAAYEASRASIFVRWVELGDGAIGKPRLRLSGIALFGGVWSEDEIRSVEGPDALRGGPKEPLLVSGSRSQAGRETGQRRRSRPHKVYVLGGASYLELILENDADRLVIAFAPKNTSMAALPLPYGNATDL